MFSAVKGFISRHRQKFIFGGIVIGGVVLISDYAKRVWKEAQEKETQEILERNKKHQHYEGTEEMCNKTAITMVPTLHGVICNHLKTQEILELLKKKSAKKVQLWKQLMVISFAKVTVMVYASSFMMILLRVQLNLMGGYIFRDNTDGTKKLDSSSQEKYLSIFNKMVEDGISELINFIQPRVSHILKDKSLKDDITIRDIEKIFWSIKSMISITGENPCRNLLKYCLPNMEKQESNGINGNVYDRILDETRDILEGYEVYRLATSAVDNGFALVVDELSDRLRKKCSALEGNKSNSMTASTSSDIGLGNLDDFSDFSTVSLPMARVIPLVNDLVPDVYRSNGFADSLMYKLILMEPLKVLGANVYESFSSNI